MSFDEFADQVEFQLMEILGLTEIQVADFISPRTIRMIQSREYAQIHASSETELGLNVFNFARCGDWRNKSTGWLDLSALNYLKRHQGSIEHKHQ